MALCIVATDLPAFSSGLRRYAVATAESLKRAFSYFPASHSSAGSRLPAVYKINKLLEGQAESKPFPDAASLWQPRNARTRAKDARTFLNLPRLLFCEQTLPATLPVSVDGKTRGYSAAHSQGALPNMNLCDEHTVSWYHSNCAFCKTRKIRNDVFVQAK